MPLGFDENKTRLIQLNKDSTELSSNPDAKKHYRYYVDKPLEDSIFMDKNTDEFDVKRGKRVVEDSLFSSLMGADTKEKIVGKFKGWIEIISDTDKQLLEKNALAKLAPGLKDKRSVSSRSVSTRKQVKKSKNIFYNVN